MKFIIFVALILSIYSVDCSNEKLTFQRICPNNTFFFEKQEINGFYMIEEKDIKIKAGTDKKFIDNIKSKLDKDYLIEDVHDRRVFYKNLNRLVMDDEQELAFGNHELEKYYNQQLSKLNKFIVKTLRGRRNTRIYEANVDHTIYLPAYHKNYDMNDETNCVHLSNYNLPYFFQKPFLMPIFN